jgi:hypothetical protein
MSHRAFVRCPSIVTFGWLAVAATGCLTTHAIPPTELQHLDGYRASDPAAAKVHVQTLDGKRETFAPDATLLLDGPSGRVGGRFAAISVRDGVFRGETVDKSQVTARLDQVRVADLQRRDVAGPVVLAVFGLLSLGLLTVFALNPHFGSRSTPGRALRVGRAVVVAAPSTPERDDGWRAQAPPPDLSRLPREARETLARFWAENARSEHASVPAFARMSLTLVALGAPARLVEAAHRAALQEIDHARRTFALAAAYGAPAAAPGPLVELGAATAITATSLGALAVESLVDGCLLEGVAASVAAESFTRSRDASARAVLAVTARDERAHAELAWQIVAWCCAAGGPAVARQVHARANRLPDIAAPNDAPASLHPALSAHGWLAPRAFHRIARLTRREVAARASALATSSSGEPAPAA